MAGAVANAAAFLSGLRAEPEKLENRVLRLLKAIIRYSHTETTKRTPVWSGQTLRSYIWSTGAPAVGHKGDPGGGPKGATNSMAVGSEPRRGAAQAEADASRDALLGSLTKPYQTIFLTNNAPQITGLEYGRYPLPPLRQRSPSGMFRVTLSSLSARLRAGAL